MSHHRLLRKFGSLRFLATCFLFLWILQKPGFGADKIRVAFSAVAPTQGVLWVADVGGLLNKNGLSAAPRDR
jgi:hypothetical protein